MILVWASTREKSAIGICDLLRHKPACLRSCCSCATELELVHNKGSCNLHTSSYVTIITVRVHPSAHFQLVKMLITLEPHGIFCSNFPYVCIVGPQNAPLHNMLLLVAYCVPCIHNMLRWSILYPAYKICYQWSILCRVDTYVISVVVRGYTICSS